ncbi:hypothetical protein ND856_18780 [Leptospira bandrabouensis]|uniref:hypothetical protein n=1 Tax=Leptospira bandrabouensis TaxID=2484903 RepID=UPI00223D0291|nr:hypothetical protein [Leptospira bandrabouensis]MCW7460187.1 hypothetical protein [Leptospira bandrabouensis]MCW7479352.1 hypothetical protein [Leptospira bandrabouensis]MCW7487034.1 hypothetical protein [Leptospira bandrabouensis]
MNASSVHKIVMQDIETSGYINIISSWDVSISEDLKIKTYEIVTTFKNRKMSILNEIIISENKLFRDWLKRLGSDEIMKEFDDFIDKNYPELVL